MPLGFDLEQRVVNLNDTADLTATLYDSTDKPRPADDLVAVSFAVQKPDQTQSTLTGFIADDGTGTGVYNDTDQVGHYVIVATFTDIDSKLKSVRSDLDVIDPFLTSPSFSASYLVATQIWNKIEDCFDADEEGPWLRDMTMNTFNREKMESFIDMALFDINNLNPPTTLTLVDFVHTDSITMEVSSTADLPLIVQGGFIVCLRHLMTSYVEQPQPTGAQIAWQDRRDYLTRWQAVYTIEFSVYDRMAKLYKRRYLGLGVTKGLVSSKAGRLLAAPMRLANIGRGYWAVSPLPLVLLVELLHKLV